MRRCRVGRVTVPDWQSVGTHVTPGDHVTPRARRFVLLFAQAGACGAWTLFLVPTITFREIVRKNSVGLFDHVPYVVAAVQCVLWVLYASHVSAVPRRTHSCYARERDTVRCESRATVHRGEMQPLVTNGVGLGLELGFCALFLKYADDVRRRECSIALAKAIAPRVPMPW